MGLGFLRFFQRFRFGSHNYSHFVSGIGGAGAVIAAHTRAGARLNQTTMPAGG